MTLLVNCTVTSLRLNCSKYRSVEGVSSPLVGPWAAWMPRQSLQGCTCSVSRDGGRARALQ
ncbi:hypothetical protein LN449_10265, partial [Xanthomonas cannabis]|nr:hypothetical protein [Xanthomonas cannabis]